MKGPNSNWVETDDGWEKKDHSSSRGNANYFSKPAPPVRDAATGHPIGKNGEIDWKRVCDEINQRDNNG